MEWSFEGAGYELPLIAFSFKFCCLIEFVGISIGFPYQQFHETLFPGKFQVRNKEEKFCCALPGQLSFYPFIQGMVDTKVDPFKLKSWLRPFKEWFRVGRERD